jgi:hypothetical protein
MWGDIPAIRWRTPPRPKAVVSSCRDEMMECWNIGQSTEEMSSQKFGITKPMIPPFHKSNIPISIKPF